MQGYPALPSGSPNGPYPLRAGLAWELPSEGPSRGKGHRKALDRLFFHDMANLVQSLRGWSDMLHQGRVQPEDASGRLLHLTERLGRVLDSHRTVAEWGLPLPQFKFVEPNHLFAELRDFLVGHPASEGKGIDVRWAEENGIETDADLLIRVLLNMAINALEATSVGASILLESQWMGGEVRLAVHNPDPIAPGVRSGIFKRSFSTKPEPGRGLGTYAMKLFGEVVLGGKVGFHSGPEGTCFWIRLPQHVRGSEH